jgi:glycoside hydrolase family 89 protein
LEEAWTKETGFYSSIPEGNTVVVAKNIFEEVF